MRGASLHCSLSKQEEDAALEILVREGWAQKPKPTGKYLFLENEKAPFQFFKGFFCLYLIITFLFLCWNNLGT